MARIRHATKQMSTLRNGNDILDLQQDLEQLVLDFFHNIYAFENICTPNDLNAKTIPRRVANDHNAFLTSLPCKEALLKKGLFTTVNNYI